MAKPAYLRFGEVLDLLDDVLHRLVRGPHPVEDERVRP